MADNNIYTCLGDWEKAASILVKSQSEYHFRLGEWLNSGDRFLPDDESRYKRASDLTDLKVPHLRNVAYVTRRIPASLRNDALKWNHYVAVAPLSPEDQARWLQQAHNENLSVAELRRMIKAATGNAGSPDEIPPQPISGPLALFSDNEWLRICRYASVRGKTPGELVREITIEWLDTNGESVETAESRGINASNTIN